MSSFLSKFILFVVLMVPFISVAQALTGKVLDQATNLPVADASVFIENSSTGVVTDQNGYFSIPLIPEKEVTVIISALGYQYHLIENARPENNRIVYLTVDENQMEEMIIDKRFFTREELLKCFKTFFVGATQNAKKTQIKNEDDIHLYYDGENFKLTAWADKPIKVYNSNLGYEIDFHLAEFEVKFRRLSIIPTDNEYSLLYGYTFFKDIGNHKNRIIKNRKEVYQNSPANFFRSLAEHALSEHHFLLYANSLPIEETQYFSIHTTPAGYSINVLKRPVKQLPAIVMKVDNKDVTVAGKSEEQPFHVMNTKTNATSVLYIGADAISIDKKGNLLKANQVFFGGFFGDLKVADMLPVDYSE